MQLGEFNIRRQQHLARRNRNRNLGKAFGITEDKVEDTAETVEPHFAEGRRSSGRGCRMILHKLPSFSPRRIELRNGHDLVVDSGLIRGRMWSVHQQRRQAMRDVFRATG